MQAQAGLHWPSLLVAIVLMLLGSVAPVYLPTRRAVPTMDWRWAFWAMSAGFVRGSASSRRPGLGAGCSPGGLVPSRWHLPCCCGCQSAEDKMLRPSFPCKQAIIRMTW